MKPNGLSNLDHPTMKQLDEWRAGLFDEMPDIKQSIMEHISNCSACHRQTLLGQELGARIEHDSRADARLSDALKRGRRQALAGGSAPRRSRVDRMRLAYGAALVALVLGFGVFTYQDGGSPILPASQQAAESVPDIYADLDFYLWLLRRQADEMGLSPNG